MPNGFPRNVIKKPLVLIVVACCMLTFSTQGKAEKDAGFSIGSDGITWRSPADTLRLNLGGRLHFDFGRGMMRETGEERRSLQRALFRRARIEFGVVFHRDIFFDTQIALEDRDQPIDDLVLGYSGIDNLSLIAGNFKEPFSFEQVASSNDLSFPERSLPNALVPGNSVGIGFNANGDNWMLSAGIFGGNINRRVDREGVAVTGRASFAPIYDDDHVLHFGLSASHRLQDRRRHFEIETAPESSILDKTLIDTGTIEHAHQLSRLGLEAAYLRGPFRLQAEYMMAHIGRNRTENSAATHSPTFHGGYVLASFMLTGQQQNYSLVPDSTRRDVGYATIGGISLDESERVSKGGIGAWELAARYSFLDLNSGSIRGGRAQSIGVALNWHLEPNLRLMSNYTHVVADRIGEDRDRRKADVVQFRLQLAF